MKGRLSKEEAHSYWRQVHESASDALAPVCFPTKSPFLNRFFDSMERRAVARAVSATVGSVRGFSVLDIGSGRGRWLRFFQRRGATAVGIDFSDEAVRAARNDGLDVRLANAEDLPFDTATFDLVVEVVVLLHLPPDGQRRAIAEMECVCKPGGWLLVLDITGEDASPHVYPLALRDWIDLFDSCDLEYREGHYFAWPLRALWRLPLGRLPDRLVRLLENVAVAISIPLELLLMRVFAGRSAPGCLQHLLLFRKVA